MNIPSSPAPLAADKLSINPANAFANAGISPIAINSSLANLGTSGQNLLAVGAARPLSSLPHTFPGLLALNNLKAAATIQPAQATPTASFTPLSAYFTPNLVSAYRGSMPLNVLDSSQLQQSLLKAIKAMQLDTQRNISANSMFSSVLRNIATLEIATPLLEKIGARFDLSPIQISTGTSNNVEASGSTMSNPNMPYTGPAYPRGGSPQSAPSRFSKNIYQEVRQQPYEQIKKESNHPQPLRINKEGFLQSIVRTLLRIIDAVSPSP